MKLMIQAIARGIRPASAATRPSSLWVCTPSGSFSSITSKVIATA